MDASGLGREKAPAEVVLLVAGALVAAGLLGAGVFVHLTRLHPPFGGGAPALGAASVLALAGIGVWAEASRTGHRPPRWVLGVTLVATAVAVPMALTAALGGEGAASRVAMAAAGLLILGMLPIVTGLAVQRDRPAGLPTLPALAVLGGAVLGGGLGLTVALLEAPDFPDGSMHGPAPAIWEAFHDAGTVEFQSLRRAGDAERASARGTLDLDASAARFVTDVGTADATPVEVEWDPSEPWTAAGPVERLWRSLVGVDEWQQVTTGHQGRLDERRVTAARIERMGSVRDRVGARWHMGDATAGPPTSVLIQVDDGGFPTRMVTRERPAGAEEVVTTTTFRR